MANAFAVCALVVLVIAAAGGIVAMSVFKGSRPLDDNYRTPYECGLDPQGAPRQPAVKYFLVAILFIVMNANVLFFFPWAVVYRDMIAKGTGLGAFAILAAFVAVLGTGLVYVWRVGALEWER